jgi:hypothetical protein
MVLRPPTEPGTVSPGPRRRVVAASGGGAGRELKVTLVAKLALQDHQGFRAFSKESRLDLPRASWVSGEGDHPKRFTTIAMLQLPKGSVSNGQAQHGAEARPSIPVEGRRRAFGKHGVGRGWRALAIDAFGLSARSSKTGFGSMRARRRGARWGPPSWRAPKSGESRSHDQSRTTGGGSFQPLSFDNGGLRPVFSDLSQAANDPDYLFCLKIGHIGRLL